MLPYKCIQLTGTGFPQGPSHQDGKKWSHKADELFSLRGPGQLWCIHAVGVCWWCWRWRWGWWRWREPKLVVQELVRLVQFLDFKSKCSESIESMERMEWDLDLEARWMEGATLLCFCFFFKPGWVVRPQGFQSVGRGKRNPGLFWRQEHHPHEASISRLPKGPCRFWRFGMAGCFNFIGDTELRHF